VTWAEHRRSAQCTGAVARSIGMFAVIREGGAWSIYLGAVVIGVAILLRSGAPAPAPPRTVLLPAPVMVPGVCEAAIEAPRVPAFDPTAPASPDADAAIVDALDALAYGWGPDEMLPLAVRAVVAAPGSPKARYALACTLSLGGAKDAAYAQLEPLRSGGPLAQDALANVATDLGCDWRTDARALASPASGTRRAALAIGDAIRARDATIASPHLRGRTDVIHVCGECDEGTPDRVTRASAAAAVHDLAARDVDVDAFVELGQRLWCDDRCCTEDIGFVGHSSVYVTELCFDASMALRSIRLLAG
jgi:hypothetical protein